jgi:hypothetical protein
MDNGNYHRSIYKTGWNNLYCSTKAMEKCSAEGMTAIGGNYFYDVGCCCWDCSGD